MNKLKRYVEIVEEPAKLLDLLDDLDHLEHADVYVCIAERTCGKFDVAEHSELGIVEANVGSLFNVAQRHYGVDAEGYTGVPKFTMSRLNDDLSASPDFGPGWVFHRLQDMP
jgi:hypothetical protein